MCRRACCAIAAISLRPCFLERPERRVSEEGVRGPTVKRLWRFRFTADARGGEPATEMNSASRLHISHRGAHFVYLKADIALPETSIGVRSRTATDSPRNGACRCATRSAPRQPPLPNPPKGHKLKLGVSLTLDKSWGQRQFLLRRFGLMRLPLHSR